MSSQRTGRSPTSPGGPSGSLTSAQFHILVTLANGERHGYGIMQEVEERSGGEVELGPGTLYRSLRQLLDRGLIDEVEGPGVTVSDSGPPRRSYRLTEGGRALAAEEARRLESLVRWAGEALGLEGGLP
jgi:DNA-binding PadR family transcriptional regulator